MYTARVTTRATVIDQVCSLLLFVQTFKDSVMRIKEKTMIYPPPPIKNSINPLNTGKNLKKHEKYLREELIVVTYLPMKLYKCRRLHKTRIWYK